MEKRFKEEHFGMFIQWGIYAIAGDVIKIELDDHIVMKAEENDGSMK